MHLSWMAKLRYVQDATEELPRVAKRIREQTPIVISAISEGFHVGYALCPIYLPL